MSDELPDPLVPAEVDLRDFQFMPLDVRRLRDSRLVSTRPAEEVVAAILLWSSSWHQSPAASLPDDDVELSSLAGYGGIRGVELFRSIKAGALYGFVKCSDGRWYHPVVAEKALSAWQAKVETAHRRDRDRYRKVHNTADGFPSVEVWNDARLSAGSPLEFRWNKPPIPREPTGHSDGNPSNPQKHSAGIPLETTPKGEGEGEGEGYGERKSTPCAPAPVHANTPAQTDPQSPVRRADIAILLRIRGVQCTAHHPLVVDWAQKGVTDEILEAAVEQARFNKPAPEPIPVKYLHGIVRDLLAQPPPTSKPKRDPPWWTTDEGTKAKGRELGLYARGGESWDEFRERVKAKLRQMGDRK